MKRRGVRIALICVLGVVILLAAASMVAGDYFYQLALDPTFEVRRGQSKDAQDKPKDAPHFADADWFAQCNAQEQWITSTDALRLHAYALEQENNNRWVVICHGYGGNGLKMTGFARAFAERGFQVLLPDARAHGQSEGTYRGMGWDDRLDLLRWIDWINAREENAEIVLFGVSMGGATVMMASGETLPPNVKAIIEDCGYSSIYDEFVHQLHDAYRLPAFPILHMASLFTRVRAGYSLLSDGSATRQVAKSVTPTLFIHGAEDRFVPFAMLDVVYEAASCEKEKLIVAGAGHGMASFVDPAVYWETVDAFLRKYVPS